MGPSSIRRILIIDYRVPTPDEDAGSLRMWKIMQALRDLDYQLSFFTDDKSTKPEALSGLESLGVKVLIQPVVKGLTTHLREHRDSYDAVLLSRLGVARKHYAIVRKMCPRAMVLFDTVDLHFLRERREQALYPFRRLLSWKRTMARELRLVEEADATLVVSESEKQLLNVLCPNNKVHVVSTIHDVCETSTIFENRSDILFVGGFKHRPNVDSALWLAKEIMPAVWKEQPNLKVTIVGTNPPQKILDLSTHRINVTGYIPDLLTYYERSRLTVAPLRFGAGVKGKVGQSLAHGVPCVATSIAAEGMRLIDGCSILIADDAGEFARSILTLHNDKNLWTKLSSEGLATMKKNFSAEVASQAIQTCLQDLRK